MNIPVSGQSDMRDYFEDREHVLHITAFDPLPPAFDILSNNFDQRTSLVEEQTLSINPYIVSPASTSPDIVTAKSSSTQYAPSRSEWEKHRARILRLYIHEDKELKEIMRIMLEEHGFKATTKMYKSRFATWNARKYMTKTERNEASLVIQARERKGEPYGRIIVRGKDRKSDVFWRHMGQSRGSCCRREVLSDGDPSLDIVIDETTSLQFSGFMTPFISSAGPERTVEVLCRELPHLVLSTPKTGLSYELFYAVKQACNWSGENVSANVRKSLHEAGEWFGANIRTRPALALMSLLRSQTITGHDEFYRTKSFKGLYTTILNLTKKRYGSQHSLTQLMLRILQMPNEPSLMRTTFQNVVTETIAVLKQHNSSNTYKWQELLAVKLQKNGEKVRARDLLRAAVSSFEPDEVYRDEDKWTCVLTLARHYISHTADQPKCVGRLSQVCCTSWPLCDLDEEAEDMLKNLLKAGTDAITGQVMPWHAFHVYNGFGQLAEKRGEFEEAVHFYRLRTKGAIELWGENSTLALHSLTTLARPLRHLKREDELAVLEKRIRLKDKFADVGSD